MFLFAGCEKGIMEQREQAILEEQDPRTLNESNGVSGGPSAEDLEDRALMERFFADPAHDYRNLQYGDTVDGVIMRVDKDEVLVNIGAKAEGVVPIREMQSLTSEDRAVLKPGDTLLVFVVQAEDREGRAILSVDKARQEKSWRLLQQTYESAEVIEAKVVNYNKGGLLVDLDGVRGFVPSSQVSGISRGPETQKQSEMAKLVGTSLPLKVIEINRNRNRLILSERQAVQEVREGRKGELLSALKETDIRTGVVTSVCDFGVFVDIGGADGLVHLSELSWSRVKHPSEILKPGDQVQVYVLGVDNDRKRIALSIKRTQNEPWVTVSERYQLGQIVEGTITQLASFGAFARIEDGVEGLIHVSEMGDGRVQRPNEVVQEGDHIQVRIIRIDPARKRIGLSMRLSGEGGAPDDEPSQTDEARSDE
jgi:small subunit ribosomal protein S1